MDIARVSERGALESIPGVGTALREKIREFLSTGHLAYYERLRAQVPAGLLDLMQIPGVGPKTARRFLVELGVEGPAELSAAIEQGRLKGRTGFGERKIELLREGLARLQGPPTEGRRPILDAWELAERLATGLRAAAPVDELVVAGSLRRGRETIGDIDLLATSADPAAVLEAFGHRPGVREIRLRGDTKETVIVDPGIQVDLRVVPPESFGAALQYFTGSKDHNIHLRTLARDRGLKINEYGVFRGDERVAGRTEPEVYAALDLPWIPPEIREDRGEIERAQRGQVPVLVERSGLRGDWHVHLEVVRGPDVESLLRAAQQRGLTGLGVILPADAADPASLAARLRAVVDRVSLDPRVDVRVGIERVLGRAAEPRPDGVDYWALRASDHPPQATAASVLGAAPPRFLTHLPGTESGARSVWIELGRRARLGLEITPAPGRAGLAPGEAAVVAAEGVPIYLSAAAHRPVELDRLELAVRLARRAGLGPDAIAPPPGDEERRTAPAARRRHRRR